MQETPCVLEKGYMSPSLSCTYTDFGCILICYLKEQKEKGD